MKIISDNENYIKYAGKKLVITHARPLGKKKTKY